MTPRVCDWCRGEIPARARRDSITCSKRCRQARHRFRSSVGSASPVVHGHPRRIAYADPPYPGRSARYYGDHPDFDGEVDHAALIASLSADFDAWALSTSADALQDVLALCPPGVRVAAWVRGHRPHRDALLPVNSWEPVIFAGQIMRRVAPAAVVEDLDDTSGSPATATPVERMPATDRIDSLIFRPGVRSTDPGRVTGAKPAEFCRWIFELLAAQPGDTFVDVFPGSGGVARAWDVFTEASRPAAAEHDTSRATVVRHDAKGATS